MGCFVVASSFPVPLEYPAGTLRVQTYYQGTPKVPGKSWKYQRNPLSTPIKPDSTAVRKIFREKWAWLL